MELDELERRKKELELRRDIARLERNEKVARAITHFDRHLLWVIPFALVGAIFIVGGIHDGEAWIVVLGICLLAPPMPRIVSLAKRFLAGEN
jgi:hypothetical protein